MGSNRKALILGTLFVFALLAWTGTTLAAEQTQQTEIQPVQPAPEQQVQPTVLSQPVQPVADPSLGWRKEKKAVYYGPEESPATGFQTIGEYTYYFDKKGVLQTGWKTIGKKRYYFEPNGALGKIGRMYTGLAKINKKLYYFDESGRMKTGWVTYENKTYFFIKKKSSANYGAACTGWQTIGKSKYYFSAKGVLRRNCWIDKKYYVGEDGKILKSCVTPDGYFVDSKGVRGKRANGFVKIKKKVYYYTNGVMAVGVKKIKGKQYYFGPDGVRVKKGLVTDGVDTYLIKKYIVQTGWVTYNGVRYYFAKNGKMVRNQVVDGLALGPDGTVTAQVAAPVSVLLIAGHGQGDVGAKGVYGKTTYYEQDFTREFASLIYDQLRALALGISVTMYDQNYDCYQVLAGRKAGPKPDFKQYDYVLEVHFNATAEALKDPEGDGTCRGVGMYVNTAKKDTTIDRKIVASVAQAADFAVWGGGTGIMTSSGLLNARTLQEMGVSYGLLETAFIDDRDDMKVYNSKKNVMAAAVATAIKEYFGK